MLGWSTHTVLSPNRLVVTSPVNILMLLALGLVTIWPLAVFLSKRPLPKGKVIALAIFSVLVYGLLPSGAQLILDKTSNTATLKRYFFFHWTTKTLPLSSLEGASLRTGSTTSQIQLRFSIGNFVLLSELNQSTGKEQAVRDINRFLGDEADP